jgi:hypothetical protein
MPQWEYRKLKLFNLPRKLDQIHLLNDFVRAGWHLTEITAANVAIIRREISKRAPTKSVDPISRLDVDKILSLR